MGHAYFGRRIFSKFFGGKIKNFDSQNNFSENINFNELEKSILFTKLTGQNTLEITRLDLAAAIL